MLLGVFGGEIVGENVAIMEGELLLKTLGAKQTRIIFSQKTRDYLERKGGRSSDLWYRQ